MAEAHTPDDLEYLKKLRRLKQLRSEWALYFYEPYAKQVEFHNLGKTKRERALFANNQGGKTFSAANEVAMHVTGLYPDWWQGKRFIKEQIWWIGSETGELTRDGAQMKLLGPYGNFGTGAIPKELLVGDPLMARGIPAAAEIVNVRHTSGGVSQIVFKAYADGREKWQAGTVHGIWLDEEPDAKIYSEALTRTNATEGIVLITLTPLKGMSEVVRRFYPRPDTDDRAIVTMTIDDSDHFSAQQKVKIINSYQPYEKEARLRGIPMLGTGRIFPVPEEWLVVKPFPVPEYWKRIGGIDFGWDHPTAAVELVHDTESDTIYVTKEYRQRRETPVIHAAAIKPWNIRFAWPHDALQHDKGSGEQLCQLYRKNGLRMLSERAQFPDERGNGVEAGLAEMLERMQTSRWKVFDTCPMWLEEFRSYHRDEGKIVKEYEDLISASRYAMMCLRYGEAKHDVPRKRDPYDSRESRSRTWMSA